MNLLKLNRNMNQWKTEFNFQEESPTKDSLFFSFRENYNGYYEKLQIIVIHLGGKWDV